jgi:hypothetical protein
MYVILGSVEITPTPSFAVRLGNIGEAHVYQGNKRNKGTRDSERMVTRSEMGK